MGEAVLRMGERLLQIGERHSHAGKKAKIISFSLLLSNKKIPYACQFLDIHIVYYI